MSEAHQNKGTANSGAFANLLKFIEQKPEAVTQLFHKHGIQAPPTRRNVGLAIKAKPDFFETLLSAIGEKLSHRDSFDGDQQKTTFAEKVSNALIVGANIIRETQRPAQPFNDRVPGTFSQTGMYSTRTLRPVEGGTGGELENKRWLGMDKKFIWALVILAVLAGLYELNKK